MYISKRTNINKSTVFVLGNILFFINLLFKIFPYHPYTTFLIDLKSCPNSFKFIAEYLFGFFLIFELTFPTIPYSLMATVLISLDNCPNYTGIESKTFYSDFLHSNEYDYKFLIICGLLFVAILLFYNISYIVSKY